MTPVPKNILKLVRLVAAIIFLSAVSTIECSAQKLEVYYSKGVVANGKKIRKGDKLSPFTKVNIDERGSLAIFFGRRLLTLNTGSHNLDSAISAEKNKREYIVDDSIFTVLKTKKLTGCRTEFRCMTCSARGPGYVRKDHDHTVTAVGDSVVLNWNFQSKFEGKYYVLVSAVFDDYLHLAETDQQALTLRLTPAMKSEQQLIFKVIREDCVESDMKLIQIEQVGPR